MWTDQSLGTACCAIVGFFNSLDVARTIVGDHLRLEPDSGLELEPTQIWKKSLFTGFTFLSFVDKVQQTTSVYNSYFFHAENIQVI